MSQSIQRKFEQTMNVALQSNMLYPIGAALFSGGKLLSQGINLFRSRTHLGSTRGLDLERQMIGSDRAYHCASIHAEISALKSYFSTLHRSTMIKGERVLSG